MKIEIFLQPPEAAVKVCPKVFQAAVDHTSAAGETGPNNKKQIRYENIFDNFGS